MNVHVERGCATTSPGIRAEFPDIDLLDVSWKLKDYLTKLFRELT